MANSAPLTCNPTTFKKPVNHIDSHQIAIDDVKQAMRDLQQLRSDHQHEVDLHFDTSIFANFLLEIEGFHTWVADELAMTEEERQHHTS